MAGWIRVVALGVVWRGKELLVFEGTDLVYEGHRSTPGERWYRPLGGEVEYRETGDRTVVRELNEEIGAAVTNLRYLGTLENLFTYQGAPSHELARIYEAEFANRDLYTRESFVLDEQDGITVPVTWQPVQAFRAGHKRLVPDGLLDLLDGRTRA